MAKMAGSKRKIIRVLLFDPDATDSDSDSDSESQIKNNKKVIATIELRKPAPTRKPKTLIHLNPKPQIQSLNSPPKPSKNPFQTTLKALIQSTNLLLPNSTSLQNTQNPSKTLKDDSNLVKKQPSSQYKGVRKRQSGNWAAEIRDPIRGTRIWLGTFKSEQMAHQVYQAALMHFEQEKAEIMKEGSKNRGYPTGSVDSVEDLGLSSPFVMKKEGTGPVPCVGDLDLVSPFGMEKDGTGPLQSVEDLGSSSPFVMKKEGTGPVQSVVGLGLISPFVMKKEETENECTGQVQSVQDLGLSSPFLRKNEATIEEVNTGYGQSVLASQLPLMEEMRNEAEILQMNETEINTGDVQCFRSVDLKPKSAPYIKKKRTKTLIGPAVQSRSLKPTKKKRTKSIIGPPIKSPPPFIRKNKKDSICKPGNEIPAKCNSSITSLSSSGSKENPNSCILDSGISQKEMGQLDFDFRFDDAELLGDFVGDDDFIGLDDVPLWTGNFDSIDLNSLDF